MPAGSRALWAGTGRLPEGVIYPELVHSGFSEELVQNTDAFNAASRNTIRLVTNRRLGDFAQESFWKNVSSIVSRRIVTEVSPGNASVTPEEVPKGEKVTVKVNRRIGPIDQTFDSFRKIGDDSKLEVLSFLLGGQIAKAVQVEQLDSGLASLVAGISNVAALTVDRGPSNSPQNTLDTGTLVDGLATFGDGGSQIALWIMHSKVFYDLVRDQIAANIDGVSNFNVATATPVSLNRPILVTDSASLRDDTTSSPIGTDEYTTLGLVADACVLEDSEEEMLYTDVITGNESERSRANMWSVTLATASQAWE